MISLTYCAATVWVYFRAPAKGLPTPLALDVGLMIMLGGFVGARALHVLYEEPHYYLSNPIEVLRIWRGGFVYYGGLLGAAIASFLFLKSKKESFWLWADFYAPILAMGYAIGRIGCFLNGCCFGTMCELPWAVEYMHPGLPIGARHPVQLYAFAWDFSIALFLLWREHRRKSLEKGFALWLGLHSIGRILMEHFRDDDRGPMPLGLSLATWLSLVFLLFAAYKLAPLKGRKHDT